MSLLRIKNSNGKWVHIPAIHGKPGKDGAIQYVAGEGIKIEDNVISSDIDEEKIKTITGEPEKLSTIDKSNLVNAINEISNVIMVHLESDSTYKLASNKEKIQNILPYLKTKDVIVRLINPNTSYWSAGMLFIEPSQYQNIEDISTYSGTLKWYSEIDKHIYVQGGAVVMGFERTYIEVTVSNGKVTQIKGTDGKSKLNTSGGSYLDIITKNNTLTYTPTSAYHPATKKYVDSIVGNINTILETLVTVEEETN